MIRKYLILIVLYLKYEYSTKRKKRTVQYVKAQVSTASPPHHHFPIMFNAAILLLLGVSTMTEFLNDCPGLLWIHNEQPPCTVVIKGHGCITFIFRPGCLSQQ